MNDSKIPDHQVDPFQPYEKLHCYGKYMQMGAQWTEIPNLCSSDCDKRHQCWKLTQERLNQPEPDGGPEEEDGPWAEGWEERSGGKEK